MNQNYQMFQRANILPSSSISNGFQPPFKNGFKTPEKDTKKKGGWQGGEKLQGGFVTAQSFFGKQQKENQKNDFFSNQNTNFQSQKQAESSSIQGPKVSPFDQKNQNKENQNKINRWKAPSPFGQTQPQTKQTDQVKDQHQTKENQIAFTTFGKNPHQPAQPSSNSMNSMNSTNPPTFSNLSQPPHQQPSPSQNKSLNLAQVKNQVPISSQNLTQNQVEVPETWSQEAEILSYLDMLLQSIITGYIHSRDSFFFNVQSQLEAISRLDDLLICCYLSLRTKRIVGSIFELIPDGENYPHFHQKYHDTICQTWVSECIRQGLQNHRQYEMDYIWNWLKNLGCNFEEIDDCDYL